jgi:hypothetical protein
MKSTLAIAAVVAVLAPAPLAFSRPSGSDSRPQSVFYGHIKSMHRTKAGFEIRFDPAWWLTGRAAAQAKFEDTGSRDVPNDYYVVEEGHRLLTFPVARNAQVSVLVNGGAEHTSISAAQLFRRRLPQGSPGFWIQLGDRYPNAAVRLYQQYQP